MRKGVKYNKEIVIINLIIKMKNCNIYKYLFFLIAFFMLLDFYWTLYMELYDY